MKYLPPGFIEVLHVECDADGCYWSAPIGGSDEEAERGKALHREHWAKVHGS